MLNALVEHSAILLTFIQLPFVIKTLVLSTFEWPLKTGFIVLYKLILFLGFGVYPTHIRGHVIVKGWDKRSGEVVSMDVDLLSGNVSPRSAKYKVNKVATLCPVDIATVSKRGT